MERCIQSVMNQKYTDFEYIGICELDDYLPYFFLEFLMITLLYAVIMILW